MAATSFSWIPTAETPVRRDWCFDEPFASVLDAARRGDDDAFAHLWRWLQPPLLGWLGFTSPGHADEIASETWIHVVRRLHTFKGDAHHFRSWLFTIARRRAIDEGRRLRRIDSLDGSAGGEPVDPAIDPSLVAAHYSGTEESLALIRRLPDAQSEAVTLRVIAGLTVSETAEATGRTEGAIRVLCHRGLQTLARELAEKNTPEP